MILFAHVELQLNITSVASPPNQVEGGRVLITSVARPKATKDIFFKLSTSPMYFLYFSRVNNVIFLSRVGVRQGHR